MPVVPLPDETPLFNFDEGDGPVVIAAPHVGTHIPSDIIAKMTETGRGVGETDYHVHRLFDFTRDLGAARLSATHSRYVVDLNRDPDGRSLYPGRFETGLCPLTDFDLNPLYTPDQVPNAAEVGRRREAYWRPYHDQLRQALDKAVARHGRVLLIDAHSIRPHIPSLFEGRLPDLNFGSNDGTALGRAMRDALHSWRATETRYSHVCDGRFKGGYTTRHYGRPEQGVHALQIEIVQDCYLNLDTPHLYDPARAAPLAQALRPLVEALLKAL